MVSKRLHSLAAELPKLGTLVPLPDWQDIGLLPGGNLCLDPDARAEENSIRYCGFLCCARG